MCVGKITSIRTSVRIVGNTDNECMQCGCFGYGMDAVKSKPKGGMDAANIASMWKTVRKDFFDGLKQRA